MIALNYDLAPSIFSMAPPVSSSYPTLWFDAVSRGLETCLSLEAGPSGRCGLWCVSAFDNDDDDSDYDFVRLLSRTIDRPTDQCVH